MLVRQSGECHLEGLQKELTINFSLLPYDSYASQAFTNLILIQGPEESITLYIQLAISLLTLINHKSDMLTFLASGLNHYKIITGLNLDKLHDKLASAYTQN